MTSWLAGSVMGGLSLRLLRFAPHIALAVAGFSTPALAQLPIQAPAEPEPSEPAPPAAAEPPAPPAAALPVPPPAPPLAAPVPAAAPAPAGTGPAPAKAALLKHESSEPDDDEAGDEEASEALGPHRKWYGWQTLTVDGASFGVLLAAASTARDGSSEDFTSTLVLASLLGYGFGPGVVHFLHHNTGRGFASFGLRLGMPIAGAIIGAAAASGCNRFLCEADGAGVGLLAGIGGAIAIDAALLAYEDERPARSTVGSLSPLLLVGPGRAVLGVGGTL